jgi:hypothetical protein
MEGKWRNVNYVALFGNNNADAFNRVANLALHDQPILAGVRMVMTFVFLVQRWQVLCEA